MIPPVVWLSFIFYTFPRSNLKTSTCMDILLQCLASYVVCWSCHSLKPNNFFFFLLCVQWLPVLSDLVMLALYRWGEPNTDVFFFLLELVNSLNDIAKSASSRQSEAKLVFIGCLRWDEPNLPDRVFPALVQQENFFFGHKINLLLTNMARYWPWPAMKAS